MHGGLPSLPHAVMV